MSDIAKTEFLTGFMAAMPAMKPSPFRRSLALCLLLAACAGAWAEEQHPTDGTWPLPGETMILPRINGIVCVPDAADVDAPLPAGFSGVAPSCAPALGAPVASQALQPFIGKPASLASLGRLSLGARIWLRAGGQPFIVAYVPPQELSGGVVRLVVRRARLDGELKIEGAQWFSEESYRAAVPIAAGDEIDAVALQAGVERLNRNAYRRVTLAAEAGGEPGSTRLALHAQETRPWEFTLGANNTGTAVTGRNRLMAGATWGNAFGRGDTLGYGYAADPDFRHFASHSLNYGTSFASGNSLALTGAASHVESLLPEPLTQTGSSWQTGARYGMPLGKDAGGWEQNLSFSADFKYSDNNLEFAAIPVTNTISHVVQFGATWSGRRDGAALSGALYASPGRLSDHNNDASFDAVRAGAKAAYLYARIDGQYSLPLAQGFSWTVNGIAQAASGPLLGTEQMVGGGSAAVRGYPESSAFGDEGLLASMALNLPAFSPFGAGDQLGAFVFLDAATLRNLGPDGNRINLSSSGIGLNYRFGRRLSLSASYGWQIGEIPVAVGQRSANGHISAVFSF